MEECNLESCKHQFSFDKKANILQNKKNILSDHTDESLILEVILELVKQFHEHIKEASLVNLNRRNALNKLRKKY